MARCEDSCDLGQFQDNSHLNSEYYMVQSQIFSIFSFFYIKVLKNSEEMCDLFFSFKNTLYDGIFTVLSFFLVPFFKVSDEIL